MSKYCDNCEFKKKVKFSTLFKCEKYDKILNGDPVVVLDKCDMKDPQPMEEPLKESEVMTDEEPRQEKSNKKSKKKDFIEVK